MTDKEVNRNREVNRDQEVDREIDHGKDKISEAEAEVNKSVKDIDNLEIHLIHQDIRKRSPFLHLKIRKIQMNKKEQEKLR